MKPKSRPHLCRNLATLGAFLITMTAASAADLYWDTNFTTVGSGNTTGNWQGGNWNATPDGTGVPGPWVDGSNAIFSAGTDGTGVWAVDLTSTVTVASIKFAQTGSKTINAGGTINIGGGSINSTALGFAPGNGDDITINSILAGSGGLTIAAHGDFTSNGGGGGGAELRLNADNTFSGGLTITSGLVSWTKDRALGNAANVVTLDGGGLLYNGGTMTSPRSIKVGAAGGTLRLYGNNNLTLTAPLANAAGVANATLRRTDGGTVFLPAGGASFAGTYINGNGSTQLNSINANWSNTAFTVAGGNVVANGTGTAVVKSITSSADVIVNEGTTVDISTGALSMVTSQHRFWTNSGQLGKLTSSSGTLTVTTGAATGDLTTIDHQIQVKITNSGATPVSLIKNNQNQLIVTQPNTYSGGTTINGGRLEARSGGGYGTGPVTVVNGAQAFLRVGEDYPNNFTLNGIGITESGTNYGAMRLMGRAFTTGTVNIASASRITVNGDLEVGTLAGLLTGNSALEKTGSGTLVINGNGSGFTAPLTVAGGRLSVGGSLGGSVVVANGASMAGEGTIAGGITFGAGLITNLAVDASTASALSTTNLNVDGTVLVSLTSVPAVSGSPIKILNYSGTLTLSGLVGDTFKLKDAGSYRGIGTFADTGTAITLSMPAGADLVWHGEGATPASTLWNIDGAANWKNAANDPDVFFNGDNVLFNDDGVNKTVVMSGMLSPKTVTFNNTTGNDYMITPNGGGFGFTGATSIVKNGTGTATIQGYSHDYTGTVTINAGVLQAGGNNELLGNASAVTVNVGGQLNYNNQNIGDRNRAYDVTIAGDGPNGLGAITNTGANNIVSGILHLTLSGNASIGGNGGRFDAGRAGDTMGSITGNGFTLTKVGSGVNTMRAPATDITYVVNGGSLKFENSDLATGPNPIQVNVGALQGWGLREFANVVNLAAGTMLENDGGGTQFWNGPINLQGNLGDMVKISTRGGAIQLPGVISGNPGVEVTNNNTLYYIGNVSNTYKGETRVTGNGQFVLNKTGGAIAIPGKLVLAAGGTRSITSTLGDNQFAAGSILGFAGIGDSRIELKGTTQTVGGLDYPVVLAGFKAIQHSEFGTPPPLDTVSDLILDVADGFQYEFRGALRDTGGKINLTKKGLGTQFLGANLIDYSGSTEVMEGRVILDSDDFHSASLAISAGAVWEVQVSSATDILQNDATGFVLSGAGTYQKTGIGVNSIGWSGGASVAMSPGGLIDIVEGKIRLEYADRVSWTNNKSDLAVASGAIFDMWDSSLGVIVNSLNGDGLITRENFNVTGNLTVGVANGSGEFNGSIENGTGKTNLVKVGTGTQKLGGINTYSGNTTVEGGTLQLTNGGSLRFALASGSSNQIIGTGTVIIDGAFNIDTTALPIAAGTWTLVDTASLTTTFGSGFSLGVDWTEPTPGNWTYENGETTGTFSEATGVLTLDSGGSYESWIDGFFPGETDENIIGANADPDGDGLPNAVEMMVGGNPATGMDANLLPTLELVKDPAGLAVGDYFLFTYRRSGEAVAAGLIAASEYDADLVAPWTTAQDGVDGVVVLVDEDYASFEPAATDTDRVRVYIPRGTNPKLFGRLAVTVPGVPDAL